MTTVFRKINQTIRMLRLLRTTSTLQQIAIQILTTISRPPSGVRPVGVGVAEVVIETANKPAATTLISGRSVQSTQMTAALSKVGRRMTEHFATVTIRNWIRTWSIFRKAPAPNFDPNPKAVKNPVDARAADAGEAVADSVRQRRIASPCRRLDLTDPLRMKRIASRWTSNCMQTKTEKAEIVTEVYPLGRTLSPLWSKPISKTIGATKIEALAGTVLKVEGSWESER
jgi:hypothetical protein